jgi:excisionase family DNA binding protein
MLLRCSWFRYVSERVIENLIVTRCTQMYRNVANRTGRRCDAALGASLKHVESIRLGRSSPVSERHSVRTMDGHSDSLARCSCGRASTRGAADAPVVGPLPREPLTYSLAEAAQRIGGVSERSLATLLREGELSGYKIGRQWRMSEADIQDLIDKSRVTRRSKPAVNKAVVVERRPREAKHGPHSVVGEQYPLFT